MRLLHTKRAFLAFSVATTAASLPQGNACVMVVRRSFGKARRPPRLAKTKEENSRLLANSRFVKLASWFLSRILYKSLDSSEETLSSTVPSALDWRLVDDPEEAARRPPSLRLLLDNAHAMGSLEKLISESYKFIRMADDLHDVAQYLNDMRLCFVALTITGYVLLVGYGLMVCVKRNRRSPNRGRRSNWDYQIEGRGDFAGSTTAPPQTDDLVAVRSDGQTATGYMGRNHHSRDPSRNPPSFMRHGHMNHQQTTRLMADQDVVKHAIPQITTDPPPGDGAAK